MTLEPVAREAPSSAPPSARVDLILWFGLAWMAFISSFMPAKVWDVAVAMPSLALISAGAAVLAVFTARLAWRTARGELAALPGPELFDDPDSVAIEYPAAGERVANALRGLGYEVAAEGGPGAGPRGVARRGPNPGALALGMGAAAVLFCVNAGYTGLTYETTHHTMRTGEEWPFAAGLRLTVRQCLDTGPAAASQAPALGVAARIMFLAEGEAPPAVASGRGGEAAAVLQIAGSAEQALRLQQGHVAVVGDLRIRLDRCKAGGAAVTIYTLPGWQWLPYWAGLGAVFAAYHLLGRRHRILFCGRGSQLYFVVEADSPLVDRKRVAEYFLTALAALGQPPDRKP